jgi:hypothetical protein
MAGSDGPLQVTDVSADLHRYAIRFSARREIGLPRNDDFNGPVQEGAASTKSRRKADEGCRPRARICIRPHRVRTFVS